MSAVIEKPEAKTANLILVTMTREVIEAKSEEYKSLKIAGINDKAGELACKEALKKVVKWRTTVDKEHKELKAPAWEECKRLDHAKNQLLAIINPVETHLEAQLCAVESERLEIKRREADKIYQYRVDALAALPPHGVVVPEQFLRSMNEAEFAEYLARTRSDQEEKQAELDRQKAAESERLRLQAEENERLRKEREQLAAERAELEKARKAEQDRQAAEQAKLDEQKRLQDAEAARLKKAEDDRIAAERAEEKRNADEEALKLRMAEQAKLKAENEERERQRKEQADREFKEALERERIATEARLKREAEEAEAERLAEEARRPDREKLLAVATAISNIQLPKVSAELQSQLSTIHAIISTAVRQIRVAATATSKGGA